MAEENARGRTRKWVRCVRSSRVACSVQMESTSRELRDGRCHEMGRGSGSRAVDGRWQVAGGAAAEHQRAKPVGLRLSGSAVFCFGSASNASGQHRLGWLVTPLRSTRSAMSREHEGAAAASSQPSHLLTTVQYRAQVTVQMTTFPFHLRLHHRLLLFSTAIAIIVLRSSSRSPPLSTMTAVSIAGGWPLPSTVASIALTRVLFTSLALAELRSTTQPHTSPPRLRFQATAPLVPSLQLPR